MVKIFTSCKFRVNINRVEVYILNRTNNSESLRNFVAFTDLGEGNKILNNNNPFIGTGNSGPNDNKSNLLFESVIVIIV